MENRKLSEKLIQLVIPITFQNFMFALVPVADTIMLVRLDQDAMSAVSLAAQVNFVLNLFIDAVSLGASMLIAQYWGKSMYGQSSGYGDFRNYSCCLLELVSLSRHFSFHPGLCIFSHQSRKSLLMEYSI